MLNEGNTVIRYVSTAIVWYLVFRENPKLSAFPTRIFEYEPEYEPEYNPKYEPEYEPEYD